MPLSEHEQRVLQELEQALYQEDPAFADRVRQENVYRYAGRYLKWSILGFVVGLAVMLVFFTTSVFLGFLGVLIMFASLVSFWTNLRRMGKAGLRGHRPIAALRRHRQRHQRHPRPSCASGSAATS